jgi:methyltransferase
MVAVHTVWFAGWLTEVLIWGTHWHLAWLAPAVAGQGLRWWAQTTLGERWTTRILVLSQEQAVRSGPFRFLRHPNYVGVVLELGSFPMLSGSWRTALCISLANAALLRWRISMEEKAWKRSGD